MKHADILVSFVFCAMLPFLCSSALGAPVAGDIDVNDLVNALDIQLVINSALGVSTSDSSDVNYDDSTDAVDVQLVINAALGISIDLDGDGLSDGGEENVLTDVSFWDTDSDGVGDGQEMLDGTDPLDPNDHVPDMKMSFDTEEFTYYAQGQQTELELFHEKVSVSVAPENIEPLKAILETEPLVIQPLDVEELPGDGIILVALIDGATEAQILELVDRLNQMGLVRFASPMFIEQTTRIIITDEYVVKFKDSFSAEEIVAYLNSQRVRILKRDFLWPNCYVLGFLTQNGENTLELARTFFDSDMVEYAHPNFLMQMDPPWVTIAEEDFEGVFPKEGWTVYDADPRDGEYYWGIVSNDEYPSEMDEETEGSFKAWVAAAHDPASPDLRPGENCPESYPVNMDSWLVYGPFDLSQTYWARMSFVCSVFGPHTEPLEWLASSDGQNWHGDSDQWWASTPLDMRPVLNLTRVPERGDVTGSQTVWIALRFRSDETVVDSESKCAHGAYVDDIRVTVSNLDLAPTISTDPFSDRQWSLHNVGQSGGDPGVDINVLDAWDFIEGTPGVTPVEESVVVAVLDEGVDLNHEDLNLVPGYDATYHPSDPGRPDSQGGPNPWDGHGTACAGIVGAIRNDVGVVGVAPGVRIMPVRIAYSPDADSRWRSAETEIADGILWAANNGARVLSNSWGGGPDSDVIHDAIRDARDMGCTIVFASGNHSYFLGSPFGGSAVSYPGRYEEVIAVGALSPCGERKSKESCDGEYWGSDYGPELDIAAPGVLIATTDITGDDGYAAGNYFKSFNGTSSACPHVAGVAALLLTINHTLTPDEVQEIIQNTAVDVWDPGFDEETGWGLINTHEAALNTPVVLVTDLDIVEWSPPGSVLQGQEIQVALRIGNNGQIETGTFHSTAYLSADNIPDGSDYVLADITADIEPLGEHETTLTLTIPNDVAPDSYFLILLLDSTDEVEEWDEENNLACHVINVAQPPNIVLKPSSIDLGPVLVGSGASRNVYVSNEGHSVLTITSISYSGDSEFVLNAPSTPLDIEPWENRVMMVDFYPETEGDFDGIITITSNDPDEPEADVPVHGAGVTELVPDIGASPSGLHFREDETENSFTVRNDGGAVLSWTVTDDLPDWLTVSPMSGETTQGEPATVAVTVDRHGLVPDTYIHNLSITSNGGNSGVLVTMAVSEQSPLQSVSTTLLDFGETTTEGGFSITNDGGGTMSWSITDDVPGWLDVSPMNGETNSGDSSPVAVTVSRDGLDEGTYEHALSISSNGGSDAVLVRMTVVIGPEISVHPTSLYFGLGTTESSVAISNAGNEPMTWSITSDLPAWLTASPMDGETGPGETDHVNVTVSRDGLDPDTYQHPVSITSDGGDSSVSVTMSFSAGWSKTYGGIWWDYAHNAELIEPTEDGGFIVAGNTESFGASVDDYMEDIWVLKLDSTGDVQWETAYGGSSIDNANAIQQTSDGGYIVAGQSYSFRVGDRYCDAWILKLNSVGGIQWEKHYGASQTDSARVILQTDDGYLVGGYTKSFGAGNADAWLLKLDSSGGISWSKTYGGSNYEAVRSIAHTEDGGYVVLADTQSFGAGGRDVWVLKLNGSGAVVTISVRKATTVGF